MLTGEAAWLDWLHSLTPELAPHFAALEEREERHLSRILDSYRRVNLGQHHFAPTTGYGYGDPGREALESVLAELWGAEAALVRQQIVSGTQAINLCLQALSVPGKAILFVGEPYDTLQMATGMRGSAPGTLAEKGVKLRLVELPENEADVAPLTAASIDTDTVLVYLQRSRGYSGRRALSTSALAAIIAEIKRRPQPPLIFVDNCYGEFVEDCEPTACGADLMAGSLIKNPGGGLAPAGGYVVGRRQLVARVEAQLYAPGLQGEIGPSLISPRLFFQGLFQAPHLVTQALRGAILCARAFAELGFCVEPAWNEPRSDLVQRIVFGAREPLLAFCRAVQTASPVDARAVPEPALLPGYADQVIMAGGTFIQGSSSELTVDAPLRPPFAAYWQGGMSFTHARLALARGLAAIAPDPARKKKFPPSEGC